MESVELTKEKKNPRVLSVRLSEEFYSDLEALRKKLGFRTKPETVLAALRANFAAHGIKNGGTSLAVIEPNSETSERSEI